MKRIRHPMGIVIATFGFLTSSAAIAHSYILYTNGKYILVAAILAILSGITFWSALDLLAVRKRLIRAEDNIEEALSKYRNRQVK